MSKYVVKINENDLKDFKRAIREYPDKVADETRSFFRKVNKTYSRTIQNDPWRIGGSGGGAPVATPESAGYQGGQLRNTHVKKIRPWEAIIKPTTSYAGYVHGGTTKMEARPWLDYAVEENRGKVEVYERELLDNLVEHLAD